MGPKARSTERVLNTSKRSSVRIVAVAREFIDTTVDAIVEEEDTSLTLSAEPRVKQVGEPHEKLIQQALDSQPKALGSVVVKDDSPIRFLAIIHDLGQEPSWSEAWIATALRNVLREAERRALRSIALPALGSVHGRFDERRFAVLLKDSLAQGKIAHLQTLWLIVSDHAGRDVFEELGIVTSDYL
ncbi:MAG: macro domain-containing protein [Acidiferrobacterales bacterium]